jgi:hypothetical protein
VELWSGRGSVDLVVLRSSLTSHLVWHSYTPSLSRRFQRCNRIDHRRSRRWHLHIAHRLPCCRSDGIINIKGLSIATESAILPQHQCTVLLHRKILIYNRSVKILARACTIYILFWLQVLSFCEDLEG